MITRDEYADRMVALEEAAGWPEAYAERDACRAALPAWGLRQTRTQWEIYARCFPGATLDELEALWARLSWHSHLARLVLKLRLA